MRWLVVLLAGCSFNAAQPADATIASDGTPIDMAESGSSGSGSAGSGSAGSGSAGSGSSGSGSGTIIAGVQSSTSFGGPTTVLAIVLAQPIVTGDACVLGIGAQGGTVQTVTDSAGNTFTQIDTAGGQAVYVATDMAASANDTIAVTFNAAVGFTYAAVVYRGLATAELVDTSAISSGNSNMPESGTATTAHAHDLLVGLASMNGTIAAGNGYSSRVGGTYSLIEDEEVTSVGSYQATATAGGSVEWSMAMLALKAAN
jgi:hypothetical protein